MGCRKWPTAWRGHGWRIGRAALVKIVPTYGLSVQLLVKPSDSKDLPGAAPTIFSDRPIATQGGTALDGDLATDEHLGQVTIL
jgi:hypothetical protein